MICRARLFSQWASFMIPGMNLRASLGTVFTTPVASPVQHSQYFRKSSTTMDFGWHLDLSDEAITLEVTISGDGEFEQLVHGE